MKISDKTTRKLLEEIRVLRSKNTKLEHNSRKISGRMDQKQEKLSVIQCDLAIQLSAATQLDEGLLLCLRAAIEASGMDCGGIYLVDEDSRIFKLAVHEGLSVEFVKNTSHFNIDSDNGKIVMNGKPVYPEHKQLCVPLSQTEKQEDLSAIAVVPVLHEGRVIGCLNIASHVFDYITTQSRLALETIAAQIGSMVVRLKTEEELRKSEERFLQVTEIAQEWIWEVDSEGLYTYASPTVTRTIGYTPQEVVGKKHFYDLLHPDDREHVKKAALETFATKQPFRNFINRNLHKDGKTVWLSTCGIPILDRKGNLFGYRGADTDITERRQAEDGLKTSKEFAENVIETANAMVLVIDPVGNIQTFNKFAEELTGYKKKEVLGKNWFDLFIPEEEREAIREVNDKVHQDSPETSSYENFIIIKNGEKRLINWNNHSIRDSKGIIIGNISIGIDITEQKKAEELLKLNREELHKQNELFNLTIESLTYPFCVIDAKDYTIKIANSAAQVDGISDGLTCHQLTHKQDKPCKGPDHICPLEEIKRTKQPVIVEHRHYDGNNNLRIVEVHAYPVFDEHKNLNRIIEYHLDITERKRAEEQARVRQLELLRVSRLNNVGEMASSLAHELNQPLCAILSCSELCLQNVRQGIMNSEQLQANLETIATQSERAGNIIHRIRDFVKKKDSHREPVDINSLIREVLHFLNADIKNSEIKVNLELSEQVPKVMADAIQIEQVLMNLLRNALEAMADTDVEKQSLTIHSSSDSGNSIKVMISDSGHGLIPEVEEQLFNPFFSTKSDGLGVGLSMSQSIIEAHKGKIWAKSNADCGSTFGFTLPIV